MHVVVRLVGPLGRQVGAPEIGLDLPEGSCVGEMLKRLGQTFPALRPWLEEEVPPLIFLDDAVANVESPLYDGARPTLAWPLAGG